jgi:hypothetical protein
MRDADRRASRGVTRALGLHWKNINLESQTLEIRQSLWEGELFTPKTEDSVRVIMSGLRFCLL